MIAGLVPGLIAFGLLIIWCVHLTKAAAKSVGQAHGAVAKIRHALPALIAWCWPLVIAAEGSHVASTLSWLLPFGAPLIGALLAEFDKPSAAQG